MIVQAPAKINLGLHVKRKRDDGFHELESVFCTIPLSDYIELIPADKDSFHTYNIEIPGRKDENICLKALHLLREKGYNIPPYEIHLMKNVPIGAGLGGGSSDAVAVLKALNRLQDLKLSTDDFIKLSAELGSDCPFFCLDSAAMVTGRGEFIKAIDFNLKGKFIHLVYPQIHISTKDAYGSLNLEHTSKEHITLPVRESEWTTSFVNDFEKPLWKNYPDLKEINHLLNKSGAFYSSLSGSGSSVFGIFNEKPMKKLFLHKGYSEWILEL